MRKTNKIISLLLTLCVVLTLLPTVAMAEDPDFFDMQDFCAWGDVHPGWYNVGWKYNDSFDTATIKSIEVGLKDANGDLIIKYVADDTVVRTETYNPTGLTQVAWQAANSYITSERQSSAPFYQVIGDGEGKAYSATELDGEDWSVTAGPAFEAWSPASAYVTVTNTLGEVCSKTNNSFSGEAGSVYVSKLEKTDGTYLYKSLTAAVDAAVDGDTIELLDDVTYTDDLVIEKSLTIDLGGKTITGALAEQYVLFFRNGTSVVKNGTVKATGDGGMAIAIKSAVGKAPVVTVNADATAEQNGTGAGAGILLYSDKADGTGVATVNLYGTAKGRNIAVSGNGTVGQGNTAINVYPGAVVSSDDIGIYHPQAGTMNVTGGSISGKTAIEVKSGTIIISGSDTVIATSDISHTPNSSGSSTTGYAVALVENASYTGDASVVISGGKFNGSVEKLTDSAAAGRTFALTVSGGYYTADPSAYVAAGKCAVASDLAGYNFMLGEINADVEVAAAAPEVAAPANPTAVETAVADKLVTDDDAVGANGLAAAAGTVAQGVTDDDVTAAATALSTELGALVTDVTIFVQPYLDIEVKDVEVSGTEITSIELEVAPMVKKIASTATDAEDIETGETGKNAVQLGKAEKLTVKVPVEVSFKLPGGYTLAEPAQVKDVKENGKVFYYDAVVSGDSASGQTVTFTETNGFCTYTISGADKRQLKLDFDNGIPEETISITDEGGFPYTLPRPTKPGYTFTGWLINGTVYTQLTEALWNTLLTGTALDNETPVEVAAAAQFTKDHARNPGIIIGGTGTTYKITVDAGKNGDADANRLKAASGATIKISVTPNSGYELDEITVTTESGRKISVTGKSFTMPAADVIVDVSFKLIDLDAYEETPAPQETVSLFPFIDVADTAWYYSAVEYMWRGGLMDGVTDSLFDPDAAVTRAMIVTTLWRMEGKPDAADAGFIDLTADWYKTAVNWAAANGIVEGYGDNLFGPDDVLTREQMAAILNRYAQFKGYDVSATDDLAAFADADSVSAWAVASVKWAVADAIITGTGLGLLEPQGEASRAQLATVLTRVSESYAAK